jgi:phosphoglycerate dehydrogenase-like enzyme
MGGRPHSGRPTELQMNELNILVSDKARDHIGNALPARVEGRPCRLVTIESASPEALRNIDVALISRDVTGLSTKYVVSDSLERFYQVLRSARHLKWVHTHSAGLDRPIFGELAARGVSVTASSGANAEIVAHTALAGMLSLARGFPHFMRAQARHEWSSLIAAGLPRDLKGQTAVIVGWGPIGRYLAELIKVVGLDIIVVRHSGQPVAEAKACVSYQDLHRVLPQADWLLLACPLTESTSRLVDGKGLSLMPAGASLVNVARGEVVVEQDLIAALRAGTLSSAFLDVFEHEPLGSDSPLWDMENVIVTPHSAGHSAGNYERVIKIFLEKLKNWRQDEEGTPVSNTGKPCLQTP